MGLATVLAVTLLGGIGRLVANGQQARALAVRWRSLAEWRDWSLGKGWVVRAAHGPNGSVGTLAWHTYSLGFVDIEVLYRGPEVYLDDRPAVALSDILPKAPARSGTGRGW